jgi:hypothetical protein
MMTIGDRPDLLAVGYQPAWACSGRRRCRRVRGGISPVVVRTRQQTDFEDKLKRRPNLGCAQGTVFGD